MASDSDSHFEYSEFSIFEILYQGHAGLTYVVENRLGEHADPFDIIAEREERAGKPIIFIIKERDM